MAGNTLEGEKRWRIRFRQAVNLGGHQRRTNSPREDEEHTEGSFNAIRLS